MERTLDKKTLIAALVRSPHGSLVEYLEAGIPAAEQDPEFLARLIAYNHHKGQVRDAKVALPIVALKGTAPRHEAYVENALAHLADLRPREFKRAIEFGWDIGAPTRLLKRLTIRYLRDLEADRNDWEFTALQHRDTLRWLYAQAQVPVRSGRIGRDGDATDGARMSAIFGQFRKGLNRGLPPERFRVLSTLSTLSPIEIASMIGKFKFPFLIARGAAQAKAKEPDVVLALMSQMTPPQIVTNMRWLKRVGVQTVPALRAKLDEILGKAADAKKAPKSALKATRAAQVLGDEDPLAGKLRVLQERQLDRIQGIEGNWLVLADKSGSMTKAIDAAKLVAGTLSRLCRGTTWLIFFDTTPRAFDVTGKSVEDIEAVTATITAGGGTSIGCGVQYLADKGVAVDGIAIVSDGCENAAGHPHFGPAYGQYVRRLRLEDKPPTTYWYRFAASIQTGAVEAVMRDYGLTRPRAIEELWKSAKGEVLGFQSRAMSASIDLQTFDLSVGVVDYASVVSLVPTMKVARYQLLDEIMGCQLRTLDEVLDRTKGQAVLPRQLVTA